jgi:Rieske Fe-S protein
MIPRMHAPLKLDEIVTGGVPIFAWSMDPKDKTVRSGSRFNQIVIVRLEAAGLSEETKVRAVDGVVAYSAICTHEGCEVDDWIAGERLLHCTCHFSRFDPGDNAKVVDGPASRQLPALPLKVVEGRLVVASPFTSRVG